MTIQELKNSSITKQAIIPAIRSEVYNRWTSSDGLKTFIGAENNIEMKPLGKFEIYFLMSIPEGSRGSEGCQVLSFIPNEMFSFTWNAPPHLEARQSDIYTYVVVEFEDALNSQTKLTLRHLGWPEDERFLPVFDYFTSAWQVVIDSLIASID